MGQCVNYSYYIYLIWYFILHQKYCKNTTFSWGCTFREYFMFSKTKSPYFQSKRYHWVRFVPSAATFINFSFIKALKHQFTVEVWNCSPTDAKEKLELRPAARIFHLLHLKSKNVLNISLLLEVMEAKPSTNLEKSITVNDRTLDHICQLRVIFFPPQYDWHLLDKDD